MPASMRPIPKRAMRMRGSCGPCSCLCCGRGRRYGKRSNRSPEKPGSPPPDLPPEGGRSEWPVAGRRSPTTDLSGTARPGLLSSPLSGGRSGGGFRADVGARAPRLEGCGLRRRAPFGGWGGGPFVGRRGPWRGIDPPPDLPPSRWEERNGGGARPCPAAVTLARRPAPWLSDSSPLEGGGVSGRSPVAGGRSPTADLSGTARPSVLSSPLPGGRRETAAVRASCPAAATSARRPTP